MQHRRILKLCKDTILKLCKDTDAWRSNSAVHCLMSFLMMMQLVLGANTFVVHCMVVIRGLRQVQEHKRKFV
jgi:hypothetical protein